MDRLPVVNTSAAKQHHYRPPTPLRKLGSSASAPALVKTKTGPHKATATDCKTNTFANSRFKGSPAATKPPLHRSAPSPAPRFTYREKSKTKGANGAHVITKAHSTPTKATKVMLFVPEDLKLDPPFPCTAQNLPPSPQQALSTPVRPGKHRRSHGGTLSPLAATLEPPAGGPKCLTQGTPLGTTDKKNPPAGAAMIACPTPRITLTENDMKGALAQFDQLGLTSLDRKRIQQIITTVHEELKKNRKEKHFRIPVSFFRPIPELHVFKVNENDEFKVYIDLSEEKTVLSKPLPTEDQSDRKFSLALSLPFTKSLPMNSWNLHCCRVSKTEEDANILGREAKLVSSLVHDNICPVQNFVTYDTPNGKVTRVYTPLYREGNLLVFLNETFPGLVADGTKKTKRLLLKSLFTGMLNGLIAFHKAFPMHGDIRLESFLIDFLLNGTPKIALSNFKRCIKEPIVPEKNTHNHRFYSPQVFECDLAVGSASAAFELLAIEKADERLAAAFVTETNTELLNTEAKRLPITLKLPSLSPQVVQVMHTKTFGPHADVWAMGCSFYQLYTGQEPPWSPLLSAYYDLKTSYEQIDCEISLLEGEKKHIALPEIFTKKLNDLKNLLVSIPASYFAKLNLPFYAYNQTSKEISSQNADKLLRLQMDLENLNAEITQLSQNPENLSQLKIEIDNLLITFIKHINAAWIALHRLPEPLDHLEKAIWKALRPLKRERATTDELLLFCYVVR